MLTHETAGYAWVSNCRQGDLQAHLAYFGTEGYSILKTGAAAPTRYYTAQQLNAEGWVGIYTPSTENGHRCVKCDLPGNYGTLIRRTDGRHYVMCLRCGAFTTGVYAEEDDAWKAWKANESDVESEPDPSELNATAPA